MSAKPAPLDESASALVNAHDSQAAQAFFRFLGAVGFSEQLTNALSAQNLHALDHIKREKLYIHAGYKTFDDFLDHDPHSPMKSEAFRRRWKLLQGEGDETFNLLNAMKVPLEARKLLAGEIEITDDGIRIGDAEAKLDDNDRIVELISMLHKKAVEQQRTIDRGKKEVDKLKRKADEAEKRAIVVNPNATSSGQALLTAAGALSQLKETLAEASDDERAALKEPLMNLLSQAQLELSEIYGAKKARAKSNGADDISGDEAADILGE